MGSRIREARLKAGFSQEKLSKTVECTRGLIAQYESGTTVPSVANLFRIASVCGVSVAFLLGEEGEAVKATEPTIKDVVERLDRLTDMVEQLLRREGQ